MKHQQESAFYDGLRAERGIFFFPLKYKNDFPFKVKGSENSDLAWKASEKVSFQGTSASIKPFPRVSVLISTGAF